MGMKRKASWQACALAGLCAGFLAGALVMWMAWNHNPQCEIHCAEQGIDWGYWLALGGAGFVMGGVPVMLLCMVLQRLLRKP